MLFSHLYLFSPMSPSCNNHSTSFLSHPKPQALAAIHAVTPQLYRKGRFVSYITPAPDHRQNSWNLKLRKEKMCAILVLFYLRKRGSASYIVREVRSVRERERERERERLIPKTIGNRKKRLCVRWLGVINLTWENLQIAQRKSVRWTERTPSWFVLCDLKIFLGKVYHPEPPHA